MIENQQTSISYTADGVQTQWEFPYSYFSVDDIKLFITQDGTRTQIAATDYTFNVTTKKVTYPLTGDPVAAGSTVELTRQTDITQLEDSTIQNFKSNDVERIADKLTLIAQDLKQEMADIVAPEGGAIAETVAAAVQAGISTHNSASTAHTGHLVAKTGSTMTGDLTMAKNGTTVSGVRFLDENDTGYRIFSAKDISNNKQLRMFDASAGNGFFLNGGDENRPYYWDGNSNSYRLLDVSDKSSLETAISTKANTDLGNLSATSGFRRLVEVYINGTSWYKVFDEYNPTTGTFVGKWCEQGGVTLSITGNTNSVELLKTFANTSFTVQLTPVDSRAKTYTPAYSITSASTINIGLYNDTSAICWRAEGYLASGD